jgi:hypothetical protein
MSYGPDYQHPVPGAVGVFERKFVMRVVDNNTGESSLSAKPPCLAPFPPRSDFHGCNFLISRQSQSDGDILHTDWNEKSTMPTIRSYHDGIKVGCSFLTSGALESLYLWHRNFLEEHGEKTHQRGKE